MTKPPINLQDLRRRIYRKAKSDKSHRFWGLFVHITKIETLEEAYRAAKRNGGAPGKKLTPRSPGGSTTSGLANASDAFSEVHDYVEMKVRSLLTRRKRRRKTSIGWQRWSNEYLYDVLRL